VQDSFGNSSLFHKALKDAFESFCNKQVRGCCCLHPRWCALCLGPRSPQVVVAWPACDPPQLSPSFIFALHCLDSCFLFPCSQVAGASMAELMANFCDNLLKKVGSR